MESEKISLRKEDFWEYFLDDQDYFLKFASLEMKQQSGIILGKTYYKGVYLTLDSDVLKTSQL